MTGIPVVGVAGSTEPLTEWKIGLDLKRVSFLAVSSIRNTLLVSSRIISITRPSVSKTGRTFALENSPVCKGSKHLTTRKSSSLKIVSATGNLKYGLSTTLFL